DADDVVVLELSDRAGFAEEALHLTGLAQQEGFHRLESDDASEHGVADLVDHAHAANLSRRNDLIAVKEQQLFKDGRIERLGLRQTSIRSIRGVDRRLVLGIDDLRGPRRPNIERVFAASPREGRLGAFWIWCRTV